MSADFKGYYCKRCHTYTRLYADRQQGVYSGRCPGCRATIELPIGLAGEQFLISGSVSGKQKKETFINVWERSGGGKIIGQLKTGTPAKLLRITKVSSVTWYEVQAGKIQGWISSRFIRKLK